MFSNHIKTIQTKTKRLKLKYVCFLCREWQKKLLIPMLLKHYEINGSLEQEKIPQNCCHGLYQVLNQQRIFAQDF